jgi:hypothetical protein
MAARTYPRPRPTLESEFWEYAKGLRLSHSLTQTCIDTLRLSIQGGDGCLWTDSVLHTLVSRVDNPISKGISRTLGFRGDLLAGFRFTDTLSTSELTVRPEFHETMHDLLLRHAEKVDIEINEQVLFRIELREAIENCGDEHSSLLALVICLLRPLASYAERTPTDKSVASAIRRFVGSQKEWTPGFSKSCPPFPLRVTCSVCCSPPEIV